ncbi:metallophosphoesterase [Halobacillus litoralis]|uniref:metallophosphoesterase n=1 Tax=Halobacillus litoralis TaxID=45668 RepID=UPI001CFDB23A|nr:metallophosphoesterase [Halobacillus litoralis]
MKKIMKKSAIFIGVVIVILLIWGLFEPYQVDVEEETAPIDNLPDKWEGKEIAVMGDFQVGMWMDNASNLSDVVDTLIKRDPEAVLLLGDYVYHSTDNHQEEMDKVAEYLRPLTETDIPVFAVKGNHDYGMSSKKKEPNMETAQRVDETLQELGVEMLHNKSVPLQLNDNSKSPLYLTGIGANWPDEAEVATAFQQVPDSAPRFVFMHNPETFNNIPEEKAPVSTAGHSHGGQIRIPFTPHWSWKDLLPSDEAHVDGWVTDSYGSDGNELYVNRGIGLSIVPIRINNPPEITVFQLKAE